MARQLGFGDWFKAFLLPSLLSIFRSKFYSEFPPFFDFPSREFPVGVFGLPHPLMLFRCLNKRRCPEISFLQYIVCPGTILILSCLFLLFRGRGKLDLVPFSLLSLRFPLPCQLASTDQRFSFLFFSKPFFSFMAIFSSEGIFLLVPLLSPES